MMTRTPANPITARYRGRTPRQIARLMCRSISMAAMGRHSITRTDMAEQLICEAMDLAHDGLAADDRHRLIALLSDAIMHVEKAADGPSEFFRPLP